MDTFSALLAICAGKCTGPRWIPCTKASDAELWCFVWSTPWINGWVHNREPGDLRRHRVHYDVIIMYSEINVCEVNAFIPKLLWLCLCAFPFCIKQLFECLSYCELIKKSLRYSEDIELLLCKLSRHKIACRDLFPTWNQAAIFPSQM